MSVWCSGRQGFARGRGHGFEPRQLRSIAKKCATCDLLTGTGGWLASGVSPIKKFFFAVYFRFLNADSENLSTGG
jgi:hypothetical protein